MTQLRKISEIILNVIETTAIPTRFYVMNEIGIFENDVFDSYLNELIDAKLINKYIVKLDEISTTEFYLAYNKTVEKI